MSKLGGADQATSGTGERRADQQNVGYLEEFIESIWCCDPVHSLIRPATSVDVIASAFDAPTGPLKKLGIKGRGGRLMAQEWDDGPQTYLGVAAAGYPNLFMITGPQSPSVLSNTPVSIEQHVECITECVAHMRRNKLVTIEATAEAQNAWGAHVAEIVNATLMPV